MILTNRTNVCIMDNDNRTNVCNEMEDDDMCVQFYVGNKKKCIKNKKKMSCIFVVCMLQMFLIVCFCGLSKNKVNASTQRTSMKNREKVVISVCVKKDDSLWRLANRYYSEEYKNLAQYVKEIKETNDLNGDTIHEGAYLVIPYYVDATSSE